MSEHTLLTIFVGLAALAILGQAGILFALYRASTRASTRVEAILSRLEQRTTPVLTAVHAILDDAKPKISAITGNLADTTATIHTHVTEIGEATSDIVGLARMQALRVDDLINRTVEKVEATADFVQNKVVSPVRRVQAIVQAVNAGIGFLRKSRAHKKREPIETEDEEMFI